MARPQSAYMCGFCKTAALHGLSLGQLLAAATALGIGSNTGAFASDLSRDWGGGRLVNTGVGTGAGAATGYGLLKGVQHLLGKSLLGSAIANKLRLGRLALPASLLAAVGGAISGSRRDKKHVEWPQINVRKSNLMQRFADWINGQPK